MRSDLKVEVPLQAIVLADSFERRFSPLTWTQPKVRLCACALPCANSHLTICPGAVTARQYSGLCKRIQRRFPGLKNVTLDH